MISPDYVRTLAQYNAWQNESLMRAAETLDDTARRADRGAFFGSIHATFCHVLWADRIWMHRLAGTPKPAGSLKESTQIFGEFDAFAAARREQDAALVEWARSLDAAMLQGELRWVSGALQRELSAPRWLVLTHMFNHQTHHRGQAHAMLTAAGAKPDDTDLILMAFRR